MVQFCNFLLCSAVGRAKLGLIVRRRGTVVSTAVFVYSAVAPVNGYIGGSLYARMGGELGTIPGKNSIAI